MKKLLLLALTCTIPSFMFGQTGIVQAATEAVEEASTRSTIANAMSAGTRAISETATIPLGTAVNMPTGTPVLDGMRIGTLAYTNDTPIVVPPAPFTLTGNQVGQIYHALQRTGEIIRLNTVDLKKHRKATEQFRKIIYQFSLPGVRKAFYLYSIVDDNFYGKIALGRKQKNTLNEFYEYFLKREDAFYGRGEFEKSLAAVTGTAYTGDESTDKALVLFAMNAPEQYTFLTDFVVIPILRMHEQNLMVKHLADFRKSREKWEEGKTGATFPLYQTLQKFDKDFYDILPSNISSLPIQPMDLTQKSADEFTTELVTGISPIGQNNEVLKRMADSLNDCDGIFTKWESNYLKYFFEKKTGKK